MAILRAAAPAHGHLHGWEAPLNQPHYPKPAISSRTQTCPPAGSGGESALPETSGGVQGAGGPEPLSFSGSGNPLGHVAPPVLWVPAPRQPLGKGKRQENLSSLFKQWLPLKLHLNEVHFAVHRRKGLSERGGPSTHPLSPSLLPFQLPVPWAGRQLGSEEPLPSPVRPSLSYTDSHRDRRSHHEIFVLRKILADGSLSLEHSSPISPSSSTLLSPVQLGLTLPSGQTSLKDSPLQSHSFSGLAVCMIMFQTIC